jgi:hypothetical protein
LIGEEGLQELKTEEPTLVPESQEAQQLPVESESSPQPQTAGPAFTSWLRLAYMLEFLIALTTVYTLWSEIGGQGHLDLLPWYTKLICGVGLSWAVVRFTAGMVEVEQFWNIRTRRWFLIILLIVIAMGGIVYYYHLHETPDQGDSEDGTTTAVSLTGRAKISQRI